MLSLMNSIFPWYIANFIWDVFLVIRCNKIITDIFAFSTFTKFDIIIVVSYYPILSKCVSDF